jgi:hypothetical protein
MQVAKDKKLKKQSASHLFWGLGILTGGIMHHHNLFFLLFALFVGIVLISRAVELFVRYEVSDEIDALELELDVEKTHMEALAEELRDSELTIRTYEEIAERNRNSKALGEK